MFFSLFQSMHVTEQNKLVLTVPSYSLSNLTCTCFWYSVKAVLGKSSKVYFRSVLEKNKEVVKVEKQK